MLGYFFFFWPFWSAVTAWAITKIIPGANLADYWQWIAGIGFVLGAMTWQEVTRQEAYSEYLKRKRGDIK